MKFVKIFPKFQEYLYSWPIPHCRKIYKKQLLQYVLKRLPKFKEHLFLMTAFKVYHMCREHGEASSKISGVEGASVNVWGSMGGGTP